MQEDYRFLDLNGERIFAAHYRPASDPSHAIVMCHPLGEEKLWAHRVFVSFARDLAAAGFAVLRFDFRGEGDSDRQFEQADFETRVQDAAFAIDTVRALNPSAAHVCLLGLRFGGCVAAATAARRNDVSKLLLWDPVVDGTAYMQSVLRLNLMSQMALHQKVIESREALVARLAGGETVNVEGYELAEPLFKQVSRFHLSAVLPNIAAKTLIVQINQHEAAMKPELLALAECSDRCKVDVVQEEPFWKEIRSYHQRSAELTRVSLRALESEV